MNEKKKRKSFSSKKNKIQLIAHAADGCDAFNYISISRRIETTEIAGNDSIVHSCSEFIAYTLYTSIRL